jgi:hypothetical protein
VNEFHELRTLTDEDLAMYLRGLTGPMRYISIRSTTLASAATELQQLRAAVKAVEAIHFRNALADDPNHPHCGYFNCEEICCDCCEDWPCSTIRALRGSGA